MKPTPALFLICLILALSLTRYAAAQTLHPEDPRKRTSAGKYATSAQAYQMWQADPGGVKIIDIRTIDEYVYVGHPPMAYNIPFAFRTDVWDFKHSAYQLRQNPDFITRINQKFKKSDTLLILCRSGNRSALAVNLLFRKGYQNIYNITDGFEGKAVDGKSGFPRRIKGNGWKNSKLPWTYHLDPELVYLPGK